MHALGVGCKHVALWNKFSLITKCSQLVPSRAARNVQTTCMFASIIWINATNSIDVEFCACTFHNMKVVYQVSGVWSMVVVQWSSFDGTFVHNSLTKTLHTYIQNLKRVSTKVCHPKVTMKSNVNFEPCYQTSVTYCSHLWSSSYSVSNELI